MLYAVVLTVLGALFMRGLDARGAGRAFPIHAENYAIDTLQRINPNLRWDWTNFLVDYSGYFSRCDRVERGYVHLEDWTYDQHDEAQRYFQVNYQRHEGNTMGLITDYIDGDGVDSHTVNQYIQRIFDSWVHSHDYDDIFKGADRFGCSIRPGCDRVMVLNCLFSPGVYPDGHRRHRPRNRERAQTSRPRRHRPYYPEPPPEPRTYPPPTPEPRTYPPPPPEPRTRDPYIDYWATEAPQLQPEAPREMERPRALAFTPEQYDLAELITGNVWDRSHHLENLSGLETTCEMLFKEDWSFNKVKKYGRFEGRKVHGIKGQSENRGSTQDAMEIILQSFKSIKSSARAGCSLIPDCVDGNGGMWVIISCLYQ